MPDDRVISALVKIRNAVGDASALLEREDEIQGRLERHDKRAQVIVDELLANQRNLAAVDRRATAAGQVLLPYLRALGSNEYVQYKDVAIWWDSVEGICWSRLHSWEDLVRLTPVHDPDDAPADDPEYQSDRDKACNGHCNGKCEPYHLASATPRLVLDADELCMLEEDD